MPNQDKSKGYVLITGCSTGIGYSICHHLKQNGYQVIASCRNISDVERLEAEGFTCVQLDLNNTESIRSGFNQAMKICSGELYALVNNGAYGQPGAVEDLTRDALVEQFQTNVFGTQELTNLAIPVMRERGKGRIVQISSILGFICLRFRGAYNASKYALEALSDTLRLELANSGVHVSLIQPGPIESDFRPNALKHFKRNIDANNSYFADIYSRVEKRLTTEKKARFTLPAEAVSKCVLHALESSKPKIRYPVTKPTYIMAALKRILPDRLMDRVLMTSGDSDK